MTTPAPPKGGAQSDLAGVAAKYGIDLGALMGGGGGPAVDPNDPDIYFGEQTSYDVAQRGDELPKRRAPGRTVVQTKKLSEANKAFYEMSEDELSAYQRRLIAIGILDPKTTRVGDYDDDTYSAFAAINERAAKFKAAGRNLTPADVLGMIEKTAIANGVTAEPLEPGKVTATTDAVSLEERIQATARQRLGRKLKPAEVSKFVSLYQGMEGQWNSTVAGMQDVAADSGQDVSVEGLVDPGAAADQFVDANFAQEEAGQSGYGYLQALRGILEG